VINPGPPFVLQKVQSDAFFEAVQSTPEIEQVILDMGTPDAKAIPVEKLLAG
jgi:hypothetical protein